MSVPQDVILIWGGTVATIPAGWARVTALDGQFPKATANATNPNVAGGNATHTHTSPAHSHTMTAHGHAIQTSYESSADNNTDSNGTEGIPGSHRHSWAAGDDTSTSGGGLSSVTSTYDTASNNPPYYEVVFITPSGAPGNVEANILSLWNSATVPVGWSFCDGSGGLPDLRNKYIRGAGAGLGAGATGGSTTNVHALTHSHTESSHSHSGNTHGIDDGGGRRGTSGSNYVARGHTHPWSLNANTAGGISSASLTTAETVEPAYKKIMIIKNTTGGVDQPQGIIGLWLGTLGTIPGGWRLCDGTNSTPDLRDKYIKIALNSGELGATGGSNTHTHAAQGHSHTGGSHTHTGSLSGPDHSVGKTVGGVGGGNPLQNGGNVHSMASIGSTAAAWNSSDTTADSSSNEPVFLTAAYIMYSGVPIAEERSMEVTGSQSANAERSAEVSGVNPAEERLMELTGHQSASAERACEVSGALVWTVLPEPTAPTWTITNKPPT